MLEHVLGDLLQLLVRQPADLGDGTLVLRHPALAVAQQCDDVGRLSVAVALERGGIERFASRQHVAAARVASDALGDKDLLCVTAVSAAPMASSFKDRYAGQGRAGTARNGQQQATESFAQ